MTQRFILLIALVGIASAASPFGIDLPWKPGMCLRPKLKGNLNAQQFFTGDWHAIKGVGDLLFQKFGSCLTTSCKIDESGKIHMLHYQYQKLFNKYAKVEGVGDVKYAKFIGAFFPIKYDMGASLFDVTLPFTVVDTDYDNWSVVYFCKQFIGSKLEMAWMMGREKEVTDDTLSKMERAVVELGLDFTSFTPQNSTYCPAGAPKV